MCAAAAVAAATAAAVTTACYCVRKRRAEKSAHVTRARCPCVREAREARRPRFPRFAHNPLVSRTRPPADVFPTHTSYYFTRLQFPLLLGFDEAGSPGTCTKTGRDRFFDLRFALILIPPVARASQISKIMIWFCRLRWN